VNSCLLPLGLLPGREVVTVEALAEGERLHPVQQAMVDCAGSQCGYCTPGFVMSLFVGYYDGELSDHTIEGNLCRCTGYRPIREQRSTALLAPDVGDATDRFRIALTVPRTPLSATGAQFHNPTDRGRSTGAESAHPTRPGSPAPPISAST
jgi:xanthine dehydrogenase small subunit